MNFKSFLTEMFIHPLSRLTPKSQLTFIAWRQHLWIGSHQDIENNSQLIYNQIIAEHPRTKEIVANQYRQDPEDIFNWVRDHIADGISGQYNPLTKQIYVGGDGLSPNTSPLAAKVLQTLKAKMIEQEYSDDRTIKYRRSQVQNQFPQLLYHGTATDYFSEIVRLGIMPRPEQSNYKDISHPDKIFLTASLPEAEMHAIHTAKGGYSYKNRSAHKGCPMVVVVHLPDPAKITPDMDVDRQASGINYDHSYWYNHNDDPDKFYSVNSKRAGMHTGLFGYQGRIPAKFIDHIRVYSNYDKTWKKLTPDKFPKVINKLNDQGNYFWEYLLGYPEE